jgi:hypothetical protein
VAAGHVEGYVFGNVGDTFAFVISIGHLVTAFAVVGDFK